MNRRFTIAAVGMAAIGASVVLAQPAKDTKPAPGAPASRPATPAAQPPASTPAKPATPGHPGKDIPPGALPEGFTPEMMKACEEAATPGPNHAFLTEAVGTWTGKSTMWMSAGAPPMTSECTSVIKPLLDGRFTTCEVSGDMAGMGPFNGFGLYGYDNVSKKFQMTWVDSCGTGMANGTGELSSDGRTMTWTFTCPCPIQKKPVTFREVERRTGKDSMTLEMYGPDIQTGKEYKMMEIAFTRKPGATAGSGSR